MSDSTHDLLIRGIAAAKSGDVSEARFFLEWLLRLEAPMDERIDAWYWLSEISTDASEKRALLEEMLVNDSGEPRARRILAILDGKLSANEQIDSNRFIQDRESEPQNTSGRSYTCEQCGGRLTFSPDGHSLQCEYCEAQKLVKEAEEGKRDSSIGENFTVALATARGHNKPVVTKVLVCSGCGCQILLEAEALSVTCPHCDTPFTVDSIQSKALVEASAIIPTHVKKVDAMEAVFHTLLDHFDKLPTEITPLRHVFIPAWLFTLGGKISWRGVIHEKKGLKPEEGMFSIWVEDVPILATRRLTELLSAALADFDLQGMIPFNTDYLAGWTAETYTLPPVDASLEARQMVFQHEQEKARLNIPAEVEEIIFSSASMVVDSYRLLLLPYWLCEYSNEGKPLPIVVNAQTGRVFAELPEGQKSNWLDRLLGI